MHGKRIATIPLATQLWALRSRFPGSSGKISHRRLEWECRLQPLTITDTYLIRIEYRLLSFPEVFISEGRLVDEEKLEKVPHKYNFYADGRIKACLDKYDWSSDLFLADSIVPWAMEWALYYEIWLATGKWKASEAPHGTSENTKLE